MNDVRLNRQFVETDDEEEAYRLLFNAYYETVFNTVKRRRQNHPDTVVNPDEITSDTFIKTVKKRKEIQEPEKLLQWLVKVDPIASNLDALINCLPEKNDRWIMERYFDRQSLSEITEALGISRSNVEKMVERMITDWKKAAKDNPTDPVYAMVKKER